MAISLKSHSVKSEINVDGLEVTPVRQLVYTAPLGGALIYSLQLSNIGDFDTVAVVRCFDEDDNEYRVIPIAIPPKKERFILEKYAVLMEDEYLTIEADSNDLEAVLTVADGVPVQVYYGSLKVNITGASGKWSIDDGNTWYDSGYTITELRTGNYTVIFNEVEGFETPASKYIYIERDKLTEINAGYIEIIEPTEQQGVLKVNLLGTEDGKWSIDGTNWQSSGYSLLLDVGSYTVQFKAVEGYETPANKAVSIMAEQTIEISASYALVLTASTVLVSGRNEQGQLGLGDKINRTTFEALDGQWLDVACLIIFGVVLKPDGTIWKLQDPKKQLGTESGFIAAAAAVNLTAAGIKPDGTLWVYDNIAKDFLQLGEDDGFVDADNFIIKKSDGSNWFITIEDSEWVLKEILFDDSENWKDITLKKAASEVNSKAGIKQDGTLWTKGSNKYGELGLGDYVDRENFTQVGADTDWERVWFGGYWFFATKTDGSLWAWGHNNLINNWFLVGGGQFGLGDYQNRNVPTLVPGISNVKKVASFFGCALILIGESE